MRLRPIEWTGRALRRAGTEMLRRGGIKGIWFDVGAHHGEFTLSYANRNPGLTIYAFEPNLRAAVSLMGRAPNFVVIPIAIAETDGHAKFNINSMDAASSLMQICEEAREAWIGGTSLSVEIHSLRSDHSLGYISQSFQNSFRQSPKD